MNKDINIIVAIGKHYEIGLSNKLLCYIKPDLEYFKKTTENHIMIMGRKTFLSLPNGPLKNRENIVITKKDDFTHEGIHLAKSIEESLEIARNIDPDNQKKIFIIGGASIYKQFMPLADKLYITHIFEDFEADVHFPIIGKEWKLEKTFAERENIEHMHPHMFAIYKKS
jgi:dihydrofolate reductase